MRWLLRFVMTTGRLSEFLRYAVVSGSSLGLDLAIFAMLVRQTSISAALAGALSCLAGLILHYLLSIQYVFDPKMTGKSRLRLFTEYLVTGAMGFVITATAIYLAVDIAGLPALVGKAAGVGTTFVSVYLVRAGFVFSPREAGIAPATPLESEHTTITWPLLLGNLQDAPAATDKRSQA